MGKTSKGPKKPPMPKGGSMMPKGGMMGGKKGC